MSWGAEGLQVKASDELPEGATKAICEITETFSLRQGRRFKIKLADKRASLDSLCRQMGWNAPEKIDARVAVVTLADVVKSMAEQEGLEGG